MNKEKIQRVAGIVLMAVLAIAAVGGWFLPIEAPEERAVRERIAIDARDDSYFHSGADVYVYSDDHSTQKLHIDGATGNLDVEGTGNFAGAVVLQDNLTIAGTASFGCTTATISNDLALTGTLTAEDVVITDTLTMAAGDIDLDGDGFDVDITAGFSIDGDAASNVTVAGAGLDLTLESEAGSVIVKGDEAAATGITLDADDAAGTGVTINVGSSGGLNIGGGVTNIGGGSPGVAAGDNDLYVTADLEVDGAFDVDGATTLDEVAVDGDLTVGNDSSGGNLDARNEFVGLPRWAMVDLAAGTNPDSETVDCMDATPTGEWAEVDAGTNVVVSADTSYYRADTNSIKLAVTTVADNDGLDCTIPAQDDFSGLESIGFWLYSDEAITAGDIDLTVDDSDGTDQVYTTTITCSANVWTWIEVDISGCDANCDTTDGFFLLFTAQGASNLSSPDIYIDELFYWDSADEEALGQSIVDHGVIGVLANATAGGGIAILAEYTDYMVHYESGNDFIVWISDQSANDAAAFVAY